MGDKLQAVGDKVSGVGETLTKSVTAPVVGLGTAAVATAANFESSMSQVQATMGITKDAMSTVNGESVNTMDTLSALAKQMGNETAFSASECAEALNYLALAGYDTQEMCDTLPTVLNLAAAGGIDLASASDMVTDAMSALGMGTDEATTMVDQMAKTSSTTNTSVAQLGDAILTIGATAKSVKGGTAELNTALGILANNGIKGAEGGTHLRNVILSLQNPTDKAAACMEQLGVDVYDSEGNMRSLNDVLGDLNTSMDDMTSAEKSNIIATIFNKTDLAAVNALLANTGESWDGLQQSIVDSSGAAQQMADTQLDNLQGQLTILKSALEGLAMGEILLPIIKNVVSGIQGFVDWLNSLDEGTKQTIVTIGLIVAAVGPVLIVIGKVISAVGTILSVVSKIGPVIGAVKTAATGLFTVLAANPIGLVVAAIAALIAIFVALWNNCEGFREFWINLWNVIKDAAVAVWNGLKDFFSNIWNAITGAAQSIWNGLKDFFSGLWEGIKNIFQTVLDVIKTLIVARFEFYKTIITTVLNVIQTVVSTVWNAIKTVIETVTNAIGSFLSSAWEAIRNTVTTVMEAIRSVITSVWEAIKSAVTAVLSAIKDVVVSAWEAIKSAITTAMEAIRSAVIAAWEAIKSAVSSAIEAIKNVAVAAWEAIKSAVISIMEAIKSAITAAWEAIKSAVSSVVNAIKEVITSVWNAIKSTVTSIVGGLKDAVVNVFNSLLLGIKNAMSGIAGAVKSGFDAAINFIKGLPSQALQWGKDIIGGLIDGIKSKISGLVDSVKDIAGTIASFLHFSEPDEGPLSNFHTFMPDMIDLLGKGIRGNLGKLTGPMKELAGMLIPTTGAMESITSSGNGGNGNASLAARLDAMYEVVTKYLPRLANSQVVLDSGVLVGELSDGLNRELGKAYS